MKWVSFILIIIIFCLIIFWIGYSDFSKVDYLKILNLQDLNYSHFQNLKENNLLFEQENFFLEQGEGVDIYYFKEGRLACIEVTGEQYQFKKVGIFSSREKVEKAFRFNKKYEIENGVKFEDGIFYICFMFDQTEKVEKIIISYE